MTHRMLHLMVRAKATGLLPQDAEPPVATERPWPVVLLTALGAWLAAVPLLGLVGMLFGDLFERGAGVYGVGALVLVGAVLLLRAGSVPPFVEQLAVPALWVGGGSIGYGLFRDLPFDAAAALLALLALGLAAAITRPWMRVLLGALAAVLAQIAWANVDDMAKMVTHWGFGRLWLVVHASLLIWLGSLWAQSHAALGGSRPRLAAALESISAGWLLATLGALVILAGMGFPAGGSMMVTGQAMGENLTRGHGGAMAVWAMPLGSVLAALLAAGKAARAWPALRTASQLGVYAVLIGLAAFMPTLGAIWLALALCVTTQRWRLAVACGVAAAGVLSSFYYQLSWLLASKALVLVLAGAVLGALAWWGRRNEPSPRADATPGVAGRGRLAQGLIGLAALATLGVANFGIFEKEGLIEKGRPIFVELAPVDPRSLMQGDYMRLAYRLPDELRQELDRLPTRSRPQILLQRDARGVATPLRMASAGEMEAGKPSRLAAGEELRVELSPKGGRWVFVSDAWFFREGDGERWSRARYGEFRVAGDGRALLVGLADAELRRIEP